MKINILKKHEICIESNDIKKYNKYKNDAFLIKQYMDLHQMIPSQHNKDLEIRRLSIWLSHQRSNKHNLKDWQNEILNISGLQNIMERKCDIK